MRKLAVILASVLLVPAAFLGLAASPASASDGRGPVTFFEHNWGSGASFSVNPGYGIADLHAQPLGCFFWCWGDFNDKISSVRTNGCGATLFEHVNFKGRT